MSTQDIIMSGVEYDTNGGCWLWAGSREVSLRGKVTIAPNKQVLAYRASYEAFVGEIPAGMMVCHRCDVPACVRPDHLFIGTAHDNVADMIAKGRRKQGVMPRGAHHPLSKLDDDTVLAIRALKGRFGDKRISNHFGLRSRNTVPAIWHGKTWKHLIGAPMTQRAEAILESAVCALEKLPPKRKLTPDAVSYIRKVYEPRHPVFGARPLAEKFGVTTGAISMAASGQTWPANRAEAA